MQGSSLRCNSDQGVRQKLLKIKLKKFMSKDYMNSQQEILSQNDEQKEKENEK